jgi:DNA modification methylase
MSLGKNQLFYGDNYEVLQKYIKDESIDLVYIDPPFNSKRNYNQIYNNIGTEDKAQAQAFVDTWSWTLKAEEALEEILLNKTGNYTKQVIKLIEGLRWVLDKGSLLAYLVSMTQRINEIWRVLKPTGSFYLHCDPTASHYLKLVCDALFSSRGGEFQNEIIWCYKERELSKKHYNRKHDNIFFYTKSKEYTFNPNQILEPYSDYTLEKKFKYQDENGFYRLRYKDGRNDPKEENEDTYRQYSSKGVLPRDWWQIPILNQAAKERLGYPTQKPEALLEKIIKASSNEEDIILDCYCGCGTTIAVAQRLNRNWIGVDITYQSISLIIQRLEKTFGEENLEINLNRKNKKKIENPISQIKLSGVPQDLEGARALANKQDDRLRKEFEKWAILTYSNNRAIINEKKGSDKGIDGIAYFYKDFKQNLGKALFQVKSGKVSSKDIRDLRGTIEREKAELGYFITLEEPSKDMLKEALESDYYKHELSNKNYNKIQIITIQEIIEGEILELPLGGLEVVKSALRDWDYDNKQKSIFNEEIN